MHLWTPPTSTTHHQHHHRHPNKISSNIHQHTKSRNDFIFDWDTTSTAEETEWKYINCILNDQFLSHWSKENVCMSPSVPVWERECVCVWIAQWQRISICIIMLISWIYFIWFQLILSLKRNQFEPICICRLNEPNCGPLQFWRRFLTCACLLIITHI